MRVTLLATLWALAACAHDPQFEKMCRKIKIGMTRAEAERVMTAGQLMCSRLNPSETRQKWEHCEGRASETAERLQWVHSVALASRPNICSVELDAEKRVAETEYARPDYYE